MRVHLGVWGSFIHTLLIPESMKCNSQASFLARTFANLCLSREPKAKVVTVLNFIWSHLILRKCHHNEHLVRSLFIKYHYLILNDNEHDTLFV
jgi:hypothetical protein